MQGVDLSSILLLYIHTMLGNFNGSYFDVSLNDDDIRSRFDCITN